MNNENIVAAEIARSTLEKGFNKNTIKKVMTKKDAIHTSRITRFNVGDNKNKTINIFVTFDECILIQSNYQFDF